jgi:magnesium chelatase subunit D
VEREGIASSWPARIAVIALDEGLESEDRPPIVLMDRLGLWIDLEGISPRHLDPGPWDALAVARARRRWRLSRRPSRRPSRRLSR